MTGIAVVMVAAALLSVPASASSGPYVDASAWHGRGDLAFVSDGALYVLDGTDGRLRRLSGSFSGASNPSYSPGGQWLIYETQNGARSWLARADGLDVRRLPGSASWLPDGQLWIGSSTYAVEVSGAPRRTGSLSRTLVSVSAGGTYVFQSSSMHVNPPHPSKGLIQIETSNSARGPRTLWYRARVSFTPAGGLEGTFPGNVTVLPHQDGLLLTISSYCCDYADGQPLYELRKPLARPIALGTVLARSVRPSFGPDATFGLAAGGGRVAWSGKHVELCSALRGRCAILGGTNGQLSLDPAWSPDGRMLAFVAARPGPAGPFEQSQIAAWYATRHLELLGQGSSRPVEVPGTTGAAAPSWSADSTSLLYVSDDALYLTAHPGGPGVEIAGPLFVPDAWPAYYAQVDWDSQFAWSESAPAEQAATGPAA